MTDTLIQDFNALSLKAKGNDLFQAKQYAQAAQEYSQILEGFREKSPEDFNKTILCNRALCYIELGQWNQAKDDLEAILKDKEPTPGPIISKAYFRLARCHFELGTYEDAKVQIENCEKSLDRITTTQLSPSVQGLKRSIIDKIDEKKSRKSKKNKKKKSEDNKPSQGLRPFIYEAKVLGVPTPPFTKLDQAPSSLFAPTGSETMVSLFLACLIDKYYHEVLHSHEWLCWNCFAPAVGLVNTPTSHLHLDPPKVLDFVLPVCQKGGECEFEAKEMMNEMVMQAQAGTVPV